MWFISPYSIFTCVKIDYFLLSIIIIRKISEGIFEIYQTFRKIFFEWEIYYVVTIYYFIILLCNYSCLYYICFMPMLKINLWT